MNIPSELLRPNRPWRVFMVLIGIIVGQSMLYGPCLLGTKVLLPLDILTEPGIFIPRGPETEKVKMQDPTLSDLVYSKEPWRRFLAEELQAGRFPLWIPSQFAGSPFWTSKLSPFVLVQASTTAPIAVAWTELACALVAGLGAYGFFRRALASSFWPACVGAWCFPLTGFFVLWQGNAVNLTACWLPWMFWAINAVVRSLNHRVVIGLALATFATLTSGQLDIAGQVLLVSGLFAVWCLVVEFRTRWRSWLAARSAVMLVVGWTLGFMLAAPHWLPAVEYSLSGSRMQERGIGSEERPPIGLAALPQIITPDCYGRSTQGSLLTQPYGPQNSQEGSTAAYAGVTALLLLAPLAFRRREQLPSNLCLAGLAVLGVSWLLEVPLIVEILRMPLLNMMSHNRLTFVTNLAVLALAVRGLDAAGERGAHWSRWWTVTPLLAVSLATWCAYRAFVPAEAIAIQLDTQFAEGRLASVLQGAGEVAAVKSWYSRHFLAAAVLCVAVAVGWWLAGTQFLSRLPPRPLFALLLIIDLFWFARGRSPQNDPALYYPKVPALEQLRQATAKDPGRIIGFNCLLANLAGMAGLRDVRGYDGVDPSRLMDLLAQTTDAPSAAFKYAMSQRLIPRVIVRDDGQILLPPILDMLGVRHVIFRGDPPANTRPMFQSPDYVVIENPNALPRLFVPAHVKTVMQPAARLQYLASYDFKPREVALTEQPLDLPEESRGTIELVEERPTWLVAEASMATPGLVVLADLWDPGWQATVNGMNTPILRVNHAVRGVVVPAGKSRLEFQYAPRSFRVGCWLAGLAALGVVAWTIRMRGRGLAHSHVLP